MYSNGNFRTALTGRRPIATAPLWLNRAHQHSEFVETLCVNLRLVYRNVDIRQHLALRMLRFRSHQIHRGAGIFVVPCV